MFSNGSSFWNVCQTMLIKYFNSFGELELSLVCFVSMNVVVHSNFFSPLDIHQSKQEVNYKKLITNLANVKTSLDFHQVTGIHSINIKT